MVTVIPQGRRNMLLFGKLFRVGVFLNHLHITLMGKEGEPKVAMRMDFEHIK